jgi:hypothetical protein
LGWDLYESLRFDGRSSAGLTAFFGTELPFGFDCLHFDVRTLAIPPGNMVFLWVFGQE